MHPRIKQKIGNLCLIFSVWSIRQIGFKLLQKFPAIDYWFLLSQVSLGLIFSFFGEKFEAQQCNQGCENHNGCISEGQGLLNQTLIIPRRVNSYKKQTNRYERKTDHSSNKSTICAGFLKLLVFRGFSRASHRRNTDILTLGSQRLKHSSFATKPFSILKKVGCSVFWVHWTKSPSWSGHLNNSPNLVDLARVNRHLLGYLFCSTQLSVLATRPADCSNWSTQLHRRTWVCSLPARAVVARSYMRERCMTCLIDLTNRSSQ